MESDKGYKPVRVCPQNFHMMSKIDFQPDFGNPGKFLKTATDRGKMLRFRFLGSQCKIQGKNQEEIGKYQKGRTHGTFILS